MREGGKGGSEGVKELLYFSPSPRIDIDLKDNDERTPLHCCSLEGHSEIVQLLLTFGALDSCIDTHGWVIAL